MAMDPVNKKALKKDFKNRNDKDIDNDGDVDSSDEYLHTRRKAVSKAIKNVKESLALAESDFSVGDEVECIKSGMEGKVIKVDPEEKGKYYTVKREDGKVMKYAPDELRAEDDDDEDEDMKESVDLDEKVYSSDYNVGHEKSQFGGYRPHVTHKKTGKTMYLGQTSYKTPEHAKGHAAAYLKGYEQVGDRTANRHANAYEKANKQHVHKEEVELDEISDKKLDAYRQKAFDHQPAGDDGSNKYRKRKFGRDLAFAKQTGRAKVLATKEEVELDESDKQSLKKHIEKLKKMYKDEEQKNKARKNPYSSPKMSQIAQAISEYEKQLKEEVELEEKAESQAQAIAARIALKHKRQGTKPEAGTASADMMKMSEKDLEDYTKAKKGAPEKVKK